MREFARAQIDGAREYFRKQEFPVESHRLGDLDVSYYVLPQVLNPKLPDFALRMTHTDPETREVYGVFGVSDSVPQALRPYWAAHEIIEFTQIGISKKGRCAESEKRVLDIVPRDLRREYIEKRVGFFETLSAYFMDEIAGGADNFTDRDLLEVESSLEFLKGQSIEKTEIIDDIEPGVKVAHALMLTNEIVYVHAASRGKFVPGMAGKVNKFIDSFLADIPALKEANPERDGEIDEYARRISDGLRIPQDAKEAWGHARSLFEPRRPRSRGEDKYVTWNRQSNISQEAQVLAVIVLKNEPGKLQNLDELISSIFPLDGDDKLDSSQMWGILFDHFVHGKPLDGKSLKV